MKKKLLVGSMVALLSFGLAACGGESKSSGSGDQVTISFASWDTEQAKGLKKVAAKFEEKNPNIKVKFETTPWDQYWTKMEAATTGGNMPDVVTMHSNESYKYMSNGMLMDLGEMVEAGDLDFANYTEGIADLYTYEGKNFGVPKDVSTIGVWYNKTMFKEAGLPEPDGSWTWSDFLATAKKLTNEEKGIYGFAAPSAPETGYYNFIYQNDGKVFSEDGKKSAFAEPNTVEAVKFYTDLIQKEKVSPSAEVLRETDQINLLQSGKVAMIMHGNWMASSFAANEYSAENIDVAVLPKGKKQATVKNGLAWSVSAKTSHPKEAKKFLAFLGSEEANKIQAEEGVSIPAYKDLGEGWTKKFEGTFSNIKAFVDMLPYGELRPFNEETIKCETLSNEEIDKALAGNVTAEEACKAIAKGVDEIMAGK